MIGKMFSQLLWGTDDLREAPGETMEELTGFEEEGWMIVNLPDNQLMSSYELDPLEKPLTEHPGKSVYQRTTKEKKENDECSDGHKEKTSRPVTVTQRLSWRMAAGRIPLFHIQPVTVLRAERKKLSRTALYRQNLAKLRFQPSERRYGFFKQPCRHIYNY